MLCLLLVGLIASCPIVCGTAEDSTGGDGHSHSSRNHSPLPAPVNDDCCMCNGALACSPENAPHVLGLAPAAGPWDLPCALSGGLPLLSDRHEHSARLSPPGEPAPSQRGSARLPFLRC